MVLDYINTLEDKSIPKKEIYHAVYAMRPPSRLTPDQIESMFDDSKPKKEDL